MTILSQTSDSNPQPHRFVSDDGLYCRDCELPEGNSRHTMSSAEWRLGLIQNLEIDITVELSNADIRAVVLGYDTPAEMVARIVEYFDA